MITTWLLVFFFQTLKGEGKEEQTTLAQYSSWMACEQVRKHATSQKESLQCIGIEVKDFSSKPTPESDFYKSRERNMHDFKMDQWF